jgi:hypothetical protein
VQYAFVEVAPDASNINGGQPNANIRNAFLYRADQVELLGAFLLDPENPAFAGSRKPLVGEFRANGVEFTVVNNHFSSKGGDTPLFGNQQPPVLSSEAERILQAQVVNDYVDGLLAADPDAKVLVVGDLNDFAFSAPIQALRGEEGSEVLFDLAEELLPATERYDYIFEGNSQDLDHILVTGALLDQADPAFDIVRRNAEFADQASDHDPLLTRLDFRAFGERLVLGDGDESVDGLGGDDTLVGGAGNDTLIGGEGDDELDGGPGNDSMEGGEGDDLYRVDSLDDIVVEAPGEGADTVVTSVSLELGDNIEGGAVAGDAGLEIEGNALANILIGAAGRDTLLGGQGADTLLGGAGADRLNGQAGHDLVEGGAGNDVLLGGPGADTLDGGRGADELHGGAGADLFLFAFLPLAGEADRILGFDPGTDRIGVLGSVFDTTLRFEANKSGQASTALGTFVYETDERALWWDTDGAGADRTLIATLTGAPNLAASDFVLL